VEVNIYNITKDSISKCCSFAPNQHIRMVSEGSCDTEDWSDDADYSALPS